VTTTDVGDAGGPTGVTGDDEADGIEDPAALFATAVKVYVVPLLKPVMLQLVAEGPALQL
jgi:hypothetical protein